MKIGNVVLLRHGSWIGLPSGISTLSAYMMAIRVDGISEDGKTLTWHDGEPSERTSNVADTRELGCCWIVGQGVTVPSRTYELLEKPLAALGIETHAMYNSRLQGLCNPPDGMDVDAVNALVKNILGG